ncbi:hypothetical protein B484DRAFT_337174 [Ochromonadaceae sp. CCMP2298]|nr:hypothetical protein B484DRAFT_337174 [Ochromonadaceae sp. CCMP2298]|mmetsp:Transcript_29551/g.65535  ORF Transcript_29551/g.65535 Transcript_29551/m.65535 type:complete len:254 (+) Transcript_29551:122-883(+)|eukprot:CAMPEP_0173236388 /NCGR_PEP_ID=MMETSP1142-20121109/11407_1 /TAXON_ID=483371 /ORGANISM="non described non described, Strain CCMP2298" /LENGTH=253 /DNA_ID=CAMNT_0014166841 /DNA_START=72 /DNA_END=833 /DNA_ORIENTATION=+
MLRNVIIIGSTSGLVLFSMEFAKGVSQPRLIGSLITAIIEFGRQTTGMGVCYIELSNVSITIVSNEDAKVVCALFYDRDDGVTFGRLICNTILSSFTQDYSVDFIQMGRNLKDFYGFNKKIGNVIRFAPRRVLQKLGMLPAIKQIHLINDRELIYSTRKDCDELSVLANLQAFTELCTDIMSSINDSAQHMMLNTTCGHSVHMWRILDDHLLIVAVETKASRDSYMPQIAESLELIEQVGLLHANLEQLQITR